MSYLIDHHRAVADPFGMGLQAPHVGLMMTMTRGRTFPWIAGGVALLRRELYPDVHAWTYCGLAIGADTQIANYPGMTHSINQAYQYAAVAFLGNGFISDMAEPIRLDFDGNGDLIAPRLSNAPVQLAVRRIAGGKFRITWEYEPFGHGGYPADFQVFEGADTESVDYNTPLTDSETGLTHVAYIGGQRVYSFTTGAYDNLSEHVFAARGRNSTPVAEKNTYTTAVKRPRSVTPVDAAASERAHVLPYSRMGT